MKKICVLAPPTSDGAKFLVKVLAEKGADVVLSGHRVEGRFNVGWGRSGGDLNKHIPPNKLWELKQCDDIAVPWHTSHYRAAQMAMGLGYEAIVGRKLNHTKGIDIKIIPVVSYSVSSPPQRDFWTVLIDKHREYRCHVFNGKVVRSGTKRKSTGEFSDTNQPIWNLSNGFQIRYEHKAPEEANKIAVKAIARCGLDFGAVDIIESKQHKFYVLEVNTRPGLHGNTAYNYANRIIEYVSQQH